MMKKILAIIALAVCGSALHAHEMEGGSASGLFGLKPEYVHVLINPLPVYGLALGALVLLAGLLARNPSVRRTGLILVFISAASAWPVLLYGQHGYNHIHDQLDTESLQWLDAHMDRAERFIYAFYVTAALALSALLLPKKFPKSLVPLASVTLLTAAASVGLGAWISRAGGQISHSEFRSEEAPPNTPAEHHQHGAAVSREQTQTPHTDHGHEHETTTEAATNAAVHQQEHETNAASATATNTPHQHEVTMHSNAPAHQHEHDTATAPTVSGTNAPAHQHETAHAPQSSPPDSNSRLTDTPEGLWSQLHQHQATLKSAIAAKKFDQIHQHADAVKQLTAALVAVVHPDHKDSVQAGADKVNQAISAAHKSAHADDPAGVEANFQKFNEALDQLEQQMRKQ